MRRGRLGREPLRGCAVGCCGSSAAPRQYNVHASMPKEKPRRPGRLITVRLLDDLQEAAIQFFAIREVCSKAMQKRSGMQGRPGRESMPCTAVG